MLRHDHGSQYVSDRACSKLPSTKRRLVHSTVAGSTCSAAATVWSLAPSLARSRRRARVSLRAGSYALVQQARQASLFLIRQIDNEALSHGSLLCRREFYPRPSPIPHIPCGVGLGTDLPTSTRPQWGTATLWSIHRQHRRSPRCRCQAGPPSRSAIMSFGRTTGRCVGSWSRGGWRRSGRRRRAELPRSGSDHSGRVGA
jgi:hypothetical protein